MRKGIFQGGESKRVREALEIPEIKTRYVGRVRTKKRKSRGGRKGKG